MNIINRTKEMIGIDPHYVLNGASVAEVNKATAVFVAAYSHHIQANSEDCAIRCALADVWQAAKQYYAQHPTELHEAKFLI